MTPVTVTFTPDACELARVRSQLLGIKPRQSLRLAIVLSVLFVFQGVLGILRHHGISEIMGWIQIVVAIAYVPLFRWSQLSDFVQAQPGREIELHIDDAGFNLSRPSEIVPWKRILAVRDVGEAFVAVRPYGRGIMILKRALPDNGMALWAEIDEKLTASRYLVRGTTSHPYIVNSAARR